MSWMLIPTVLVAQAALAIRVDQVGYPETGPKHAAVAVDPPAAQFAVREADGDAIVFEARLGPPRLDPDTGERIQLADFSALTTAGRYVVEVPGVGRSWPFAIGHGIHENAINWNAALVFLLAGVSR